MDLFSSGVRLAQAHLHGDNIEPEEALRTFVDTKENLLAVGHRVVHGGAQSDVCVIDKAVEDEIRKAGRVAPLHNFLALRWIEACRHAFGAEVLQIAAFDTAFYTNLPEVSRRYAIPKAIEVRHGIRRCGFHGLAHEAMLRRWETIAGTKAGARTISLQLGSGCSITAAKDGLPVDTSMGFSPLEGLVMSTRGGDLDAGLLLYLQREEQLGVQGLEDLLNRSAGLVGMAGDADMQLLLQRSDADAVAAVNLYCYRARKYVGAYLAVLGGADAILFGGGVGENAPEIRARILHGMAWCGVEIDGTANRASTGDALISAASSTIEVRVIAVDEAALMAEKVEARLKRNAS